jgi:phage shock protein PspC (stress-responsive transcriptional regulator)
MARRPAFSRSPDRYLGGVAGGLARALDLDPTIVRLGLALAALYTPVVVVLYTVAWVVVLDERTGRSLLRSARSPDGWQPLLGVLALGTGATVVAPDLGPGGNRVLTAGAVLVGLGLVTLFRHPSAARLRFTGCGADAPPWRPPAEVPPAGPPPTTPAGPSGAARHRQEPAYLGWFGLSAVVLLVGVLAAFDRAVEPVKPGLAASLVLLLAGWLLLVGARRGRARLLIPVCVLLVPLWVGWSLPDTPRYDGDGNVTHVVAPGEAPADAYEHGYGQLTIDLRQADLVEGERVEVRLGLTSGRARVRVPRDAHIAVEGKMGLGTVAIWDDAFGNQTHDTGLVMNRHVWLGAGDPQPWCTEHEYYEYPEAPVARDPEMGVPYPPDELGEPVLRRQHLTPEGERCQPEPTPGNPPTVVLDIDAGIGAVEVHRVQQQG